MADARDDVTGLRQWVLAHPVLAFPLLYLGWAYLFWTPLLLSDSSVWAFPNILWFLVGGASPLIAGLCLAAVTGGRAQLRDLACRLIDWRRIPGSWWLLILSFWLVFDLAMAGLAMWLGVTDSPLDVNGSLLQNPSLLLFLLLLSFVFPAVEEVGLRGYYLDVLQQRLGQMAAGLINGVVWAAWHAPFVVFPGYYDNTTFDPALSWWLPMIVCHTLLIVHVYHRTGRSILAVLIFHGMMNLTGEWLRISPDMYPFMLWGNVLLAVLLILLWRRGG
ncbi:abortive infection protein [Halomonas aestuarii]|uniref:Abortive infection protein n=1 Tax=Halomonas aestuarii TaxID=1897729 RepID=A0A1J0VC98_9GAMM|nr:CPBP family intramembrane glutamic endopeptidase [Halomonas aestuarii]APE29631.1 abortive infection protein [Halomonas aestuarii]